MSEFPVECHYREPSVLRFFLRAAIPSRGFVADDGFPVLGVRWVGLRVDQPQLQAFHRATGVSVTDGVPVLYPHVFGFRLQLALLTHPVFPLPIWNALQIRNRLVRHRCFDHRQRLDMDARVDAYRVLEKGVEVDVLCRLTDGRLCFWESLITYFYRGRFGVADAGASKVSSPSLSDAVEMARFVMPEGGRWNFGRLTGDYNGIHFASWYARRFGFKAAFLHPQRVVGLCQARLNGPKTDAQTLELWIKGPVYYGAEVVLSAVADCDDALRFGVSLAGDPRGALVAVWREGLVGVGLCAAENGGCRVG